MTQIIVYYLNSILTFQKIKFPNLNALNFLKFEIMFFKSTFINLLNEDYIDEFTKSFMIKTDICFVVIAFKCRNRFSIILIKSVFNLI